MNKVIQQIKCPKCGENIELDKALTLHIQEDIEKKYKKNLADREKAYSEELKQLKETYEVKNKEENDKIRAEAIKKAKKEVILEQEDLKNQLKEAEEIAEEARKKELDFLKKERKLERDKEQLELELEKRLQEARKDLQKEVLKNVGEKYEFKEQQYKIQIGSLNKKIADLKKSAEQGSMELQGEAQEQVIEEILKRHYENDEIIPVKKGASGADILQNVFSVNVGKICGNILWESKRTKSWSNNWVTKLKTDMRNAKANIGVIVSETLPKDMKNVGQLKGVWICDFHSLLALSMGLRESLINIFQLDKPSISNNRLAALNKYITGDEFRQKIITLVENYKDLHDDLEKEKRAYTRIWKKREKQIESMFMSTAEMIGDMQGILGAKSLKGVKELELLT